MNLQHVNFKIFVDGELTVDLQRVIEVFHTWVAEQSMEELLIDVADYRHVPSGPGVLLVGLQADYGLDHGRGRWGLKYNRKAPLEGANQDRFLQACRAATVACRKLESEFPELKFSRQEFELSINDRALASHNEQTCELFRSELDNFLQRTFAQSDCQVQLHQEPRSLVGAVVRLARPAEPLVEASG